MVGEGRPSTTCPCCMSYFVYIMTNKPNGILYVGVTNDVARRAWEHREGLTTGFTKRYGLSVSSTLRSLLTSTMRLRARRY